MAEVAKGRKDDGKDAADAAAVFGLVVDEPKQPADQFGILPENVDALVWFLKMQTQWRVSVNGLVGLDYGLFIMWSKDEGMKRKERMWLLEDLRLMEREYLDVVRG